ncbi:protein BNIP5 [Sarcophilus harrisii]|uniref:protein BNIP5 n=1 Tax=Sarcophilus harrisii TaxID=9305 RepID=UPI000C7D0652|nr:protein BNIP5 [Sarcophilus harrisii]
MEKHRASWKAELWLRRKVHSPDKFQDPKKMPRTGDSQGSRSLQRALSDVVRPLNKQVKILDNDASVTPKLEKTKDAISKQSSQRNNHKDKAHKKGQHGWLKTLMNFLTRTESEESREKEEKKSKEKCISPQDPKYLEASVDPPEPTFRKKDRERGDKKSKEKCIFPQSPESLEVPTEPPELTSKKKYKEKGDKKLKEKCILPQEPLEALAEPPEPISKKKDKSNLKKAFSFKKHSHEEAKKSSGLDSRSPETRRPAKPTFLPLCISYRPASLTSLDSNEVEVQETVFTEVRTLDSTGLPNQDGQPPPRDQWPSNRSSESNDIFQHIGAILRKEGDKHNEKVRNIEDLNFKADWKNFSFTSLQTLADVFGNQEENQEPTGSQTEIRYHLLNYAGNTNHAVHRIMGWRDHSVTHTFGHISYNNQQQGASTPFLSPD